MIFIDANIFLAHDNVRDVHHSRAVQLWQELELEKYIPLVTTDYVFNEVVGVTFRKFGKERSVQLGKHLLKSIIIFNIDEHLLTEAWKLYSLSELHLNFVDCTNLTVMKILDTVVIATFDQEFAKVEGIQILK